MMRQCPIFATPKKSDLKNRNEGFLRERMDLKASSRRSNSLATDSGCEVSDHRTGQGRNVHSTHRQVAGGLPTFRLYKIPCKQAEIR